MVKSHAFARLPRLCACLTLFLACLALTACGPHHDSCEACGPSRGYNPDVAPLVDADGTLYYIAHTTLYALQEQSGQVLWHYTNPALTLQAPLASHGVVYLNLTILNQANHSLNGKWVYALRGDTGRILWRTKVSPALSVYSPIFQLIGDTIYVQGAVSDRWAAVFALDASDGAIRWSEQPRDDSRVSVELALATPAIALLTSYSPNAGYIVARRASDGAVLWHYTFPVCTVGTPLSLDDVLYLNAYCPKDANQTYAFQLETGRLRWSFPWRGRGTIIATHETVYLDNPPNGTWGPIHFFALSASTGQVRWQREFQARTFAENESTQIWTASDSMVYATIYGVWYALRAEDGGPVWQCRSPSESGWDVTQLLPMQSWLLSHNTIYLPFSANFTALRADTGAVLWSIKRLTDTSVLYPGTLSDGLVYLHGILMHRQNNALAQSEKEVAVLQAATGRLLWHTVQVQLAQLTAGGRVFLAQAAGQPYHYTYNVLALQSSSGKHLWTFHA